MKDLKTSIRATKTKNKNLKKLAASYMKITKLKNYFLKLNTISLQTIARKFSTKKLNGRKNAK